MRPVAPRSRRLANTSWSVATTSDNGTPSRRQRFATWKSDGESSSGAPRKRTKASSTARKYVTSSSLGGGAAASAVRLRAPPPSAVALMDELETDVRQLRLDVRDALGAFSDELGEASGGDDRAQVGQLGGEARQDAVDEADVAEVEARLHGARRVAAHEAGRAADVG